jgi:ornithine carbamoyltransferase
MSFKGRDFLSLHDFTTEEIYQILDLAAELKEKQKNGETHHILKGKTLGMIFEKSSTRTRVSFEVGMYQLGGSALFLSNRDLQIGRGEPIRDTARVLSRYLDGIMIRTFEGAKVEELADFASIPVINALTDEEHPCQVLADLQTIREHKGELKGLKMVYIGDGNNMVNSLMHGCAKVGMDISVATPAGYEPMESMVAEAMEDAKAFGSKVEITQDILAAAKDADVVYTDVWASMGQEGEAEKRQKAFKDYQVNAAVMSAAKPDAIVLHCLPAHRGEEITDEVIESKRSVVFDEAENRLHAQKAVMVMCMRNKG